MITVFVHVLVQGVDLDGTKWESSVRRQVNVIALVPAGSDIQFDNAIDDPFSPYLVTVKKYLVVERSSVVHAIATDPIVMDGNIDVAGMRKMAFDANWHPAYLLALS